MASIISSTQVWWENGKISKVEVNGEPSEITNEIRSKYSYASLPKLEWPLVLAPLKILAKETDRGAGDIIARVIGPMGGDAFKVWYKKLFGKDCGCGSRQEVLNLRWPL